MRHKCFIIIICLNLNLESKSKKRKIFVRQVIHFGTSVNIIPGIFSLVFHKLHIIFLI